MKNINYHLKWMKLAFQEARNAYKIDEVPVGAVVVRDNNIVGRGFNQCQSLNDPTAHAPPFLGAKLKVLSPPNRNARHPSQP